MRSFNSILNVNEITFGDSFELCDQVPAKTVNLILEDIPYNNTNLDWDCKIDLTIYWKTRLRLLKENGAIILTGQQPFVTDLIVSQRKLFRYEIIWEKTQPGGILNAKQRVLRTHENVLLFYKKQPTYNPQKIRIDEFGKNRLRKESMSKLFGPNRKFRNENYLYEDTGMRYPGSVQKFSNWNGVSFGKRNPELFHPTQKPVGLFEWLIRTYSNEGDLVFDGFGGSGTTAIAALNTNRNFIVIEKKKDFYELSSERLRKAKFEMKNKTAKECYVKDLALFETT